MLNAYLAADVNDRAEKARRDRQTGGRKRRKAEQTFGVAYFGEIAKVPLLSPSLSLSSAARSFLHPTLLSTPHPRPKLQWLSPEEILSEAGWKQGHSVSVESALHTVKPLETGKIVTVSGIILSDGFII